MDEQLVEAILALGSDEEAIAELLRQADRQEQIGDDTRGNDYLMSAGRVNVANPWQAVSDVFIRGRSEKKAKKLRGEADLARVRANTKMGNWFDSALGRNPIAEALRGQSGEIKVNAPGSIPITPIPAIPTLTPQANVRPPGPPAAPAPVAAAPAGPRPRPVPKGMVMGTQGMPTWPEFNDVPGQNSEEAQTEALLALLGQK